jgi:hypothetical protein
VGARAPRFASSLGSPEFAESRTPGDSVPTFSQTPVQYQGVAQGEVHLCHATTLCRPPSAPKTSPVTTEGCGRYVVALRCVAPRGAAHALNGAVCRQERVQVHDRCVPGMPVELVGVMKFMCAPPPQSRPGATPRALWTITGPVGREPTTGNRGHDAGERPVPPRLCVDLSGLDSLRQIHTSELGAACKDTGRASGADGCGWHGSVRFWRKDTVMAGYCAARRIWTAAALAITRALPASSTVMIRSPS